MGDGSVVDKIRAYHRLLAAVSTDDQSPAPAPAPAPKVKGTRRIPYRDPDTNRILWKDVSED